MTEVLLDVAHVSVAFGGLQALDDVSIAVPRGGAVGLIGPNGAGKTTLFNVVSGLQRADSGTVRFAGEDVTHLPAEKRAAKGIGRSFQNLGLVRDETVLTNLLAAQQNSLGYSTLDTFFRPWRWFTEERRMRRRADAAAEAFGVADDLDRRVSELSFATARRVELACVLVDNPALVLLDEPTTGLDVREVDHLVAVLRAAHRQGTTVLVVAHDVRFVMELCEHVYVLAEGVLLFDGRPEDVQRHPAVIEAYLGRSA